MSLLKLESSMNNIVTRENKMKEPTKVCFMKIGEVMTRKCPLLLSVVEEILLTCIYKWYELLYSNLYG